MKACYIYLQTGSLILFSYTASADETDFPRSKTKHLYREICAECHGTNRQGIQKANRFVPPLAGVTYKQNETEFSRKFVLFHPDYKSRLQVKETEISAFYKHFSLYDRLMEGSQNSKNKFQHGFWPLKDSHGYPGSKPPWGRLTALDLNTGLIKWQVPFGSYKEIEEKTGIPTGQPNGHRLTEESV
jgi:quinoprotein glucose dehydrogenase